MASTPGTRVWDSVHAGLWSWMDLEKGDSLTKTLPRTSESFFYSGWDIGTQSSWPVLQLMWTLRRGAHVLQGALKGKELIPLLCCCGSSVCFWDPCQRVPPLPIPQGPL